MNSIFRLSKCNTPQTNISGEKSIFTQWWNTGLAVFTHVSKTWSVCTAWTGVAHFNMWCIHRSISHKANVTKRYLKFPLNTSLLHSRIYDKYPKPSAKVLALPWKQADDSINTLQPECEFMVGFLYWAEEYVHVLTYSSTEHSDKRGLALP